MLADGQAQHVRGPTVIEAVPIRQLGNVLCEFQSLWGGAQQVFKCFDEARLAFFFFGEIACASRIPNSLAESRIEATCVTPDV